MRKVEAPSDTVFEQDLSAILTSDPKEPEMQTISTRQRINFPNNYNVKKKAFPINEKFIRITAFIGAVALLVYFLATVLPKV